MPLEDALYYYPFRVRAWLSSESVQSMSYMEQGIYFRLLNSQWLTGSIPADVIALANMVKLSPAVFKRAWAKIGLKFEPFGDGRLANPEMSADRERVLRSRQEVKERTTKAADARWNAKRHSQTGLFGADEEKPPEVSAPKNDSPYESTLAVLVIVNKALGWSDPQRPDVMRGLKKDSPIRALIDLYSVEVAASMFLWAHANWTKKPTWPSVFAQRDQIREQMAEGKKSSAIATEVWKPRTQAEKDLISG